MISIYKALSLVDRYREHVNEFFLCIYNNNGSLGNRDLDPSRLEVTSILGGLGYDGNHHYVYYHG